MTHVRAPLRPRRAAGGGLGARVARRRCSTPRRALARAGARRRRRPGRPRRPRSPRPARATAYDWEQLLQEGRRVGAPVEPLVRALVERRRRGDGPLGAPRCDDPGHHGHRRDARHPRSARPRARRARPRHGGLRGVSPAPTATRRWPAAPCCSRRCRRRSGSRRQAGSSPCSTPAPGSRSCGATASRRSSAAPPERSRRSVSRGRRSPASMPSSSASPRPTLPWHTNRVRIAELGAALEIAAGVLAKIGLDVAAARADGGRGGARERGGGRLVGDASEAQRGRRDEGPRAASELARGHASVLIGRARPGARAGRRAWQAEWEALSGALQYTGGAAAALAGSLDGLEVDEARMRANLDLTGGQIAAERIASLLTERLGRTAARTLVRDASLRARDERAVARRRARRRSRRA